jgi:hypothetical protein
MAQFEDLLAVLGVPSNGQEDGSVYEENSDQDSGAMDAIDGDAALHQRRCKLLLLLLCAEAAASCHMEAISALLIAGTLIRLP